MLYHYLDNAATTQVLPTVAQVALQVMTQDFGNPSSLHKMGIESAKRLKLARETIAQSVGCASDELFFTSGGTEAINTAIIGAATKIKPKNCHIVATAIEHKAVINTLKRLMSDGFSVTFVPPKTDGTITAEMILREVKENTGLVCTMAVNNETGVVMPIRQIKDGLEAMQSKAILFSDTVQAMFKLNVNIAKLGMDMASFSGHKIGAPKGVGALYIKKGLRINPFITGGGQENEMRSGTEPMPSIMGFAEAVKIRGQSLENDLKHITKLNTYFKEQLLGQIPNAKIISPENSVPHILCFSLPNTRSEVAIRILSDMGVYVSGGSACVKGKPSYVLSAMNLKPEISVGALRASFCPENTKEDVDALIHGLRNVLKTFNQ